jgi:hypothetical protein
VYTGEVVSQRRKLGVNAAVAALFVLGAALQLNDPDPAQWICMYLAAAFGSVAWGRMQWGWLVTALVGLIATSWGLWIAYSISEWVRPDVMFEPMQSRGGAVEQSRELYGLGIIAAWMGWLAVSGLRQKRG